MKHVFTTFAAISLGIAAASQPAFADPKDDFGWVLVAEINEGVEAATVDALVKEIMDAARGNTGTLTYNFARVGTTIYGYEMWDDQEAFFEHFARVEKFLPRLTEAWTPTSIVPTHDLPPQIAEIMQQFGAAQPDMVSVLRH